MKPPFEVVLAPFDAHAISEDTVTVLAWLLHGLNPDAVHTVVEAGTYQGAFTIVAAKACPAAHIYTADPINHNWQRLCDDNGITERVHYVQDDFDAIERLHPELVGAVDVAFVDSGWPIVRTEEGMRLRHFRTAQRLVRPGGLVFVDDLALTEWHGALDIRAECCLVLPTDRGLGVWRRHT